VFHCIDIKPLLA